MDTHWQNVARATLEGSETDSMSFAQSVHALMEAGFDGYHVDFRRAARTYYMQDGQCISLEAAQTSPVPAHFDAAVIRDAIREAQQQVPGYTYTGFCAKVAAAGCAGYLVSLTGKRVLYYGRTGETHTEYFPATQP